MALSGTFCSLNVCLQQLLSGHEVNAVFSACSKTFASGGSVGVCLEALGLPRLIIITTAATACDWRMQWRQREGLSLSFPMALGYMGWTESP
mmetsp:Transcript_13245/g.31596  ORF Transcript_13245/g.31596 Transcript_13245/m.31596 type:complete len:92 (+) Transcript_13245:332-607(+)